MPILRSFAGDIRIMPPDIYVNEMPVPQEETFNMSDFVLGFVGEFERGPVNEYVFASETPTKKLAEIIEPVFGKATDNGFKGNQMLVHLNHAKAKKAVFVRVMGEGYAKAKLVLENSNGEEIIEVSAKYPGKYANIFTAEVADGSVLSTFKLILVSDLGGVETYDNLSLDPTSKSYILTAVEKSKHFDITLLTENNADIPTVLGKTQLKGGSDGEMPTESDYIGQIDQGTGIRTGLKLLETAGNRITDFCYVNYGTSVADVALSIMAEKYNSMSYCNAKTKIDESIAYRQTFDTDFMQMVYGSYYANTGAEISGATLSAIVHVVTNVENSGLAKECLWISNAASELDFDQLQTLYNEQIACLTLKPSETGGGEMGYRMGSDYTLAKSDVSGEIITDDEVRKVNKRRLNSWIENSLFFVAAKWQGRAMTKKMRLEAEIRIRTFLEGLKSPTDGRQPVIEDYSVDFETNAAGIDAFIQFLKIKHFNTAEWILLNYQGGTNVTTGYED